VLALEASDDQDAVVSMPWSAFRRYPWNADGVVLDPASRYLPRTVVGDTTLLVAGSERTPVVVPGDDQASREVDLALRSPDPLAALRRVGVGWVLIQRGQPPVPDPPALPDLAGATAVLLTPDLELYRVTGRVSPRPEPTWVPMLVAWLTAAGVMVAAGAGLVRQLRAGLPTSGPTAPRGQDIRPGKLI
jgi:hypothetical protein